MSNDFHVITRSAEKCFIATVGESDSPTIVVNYPFMVKLEVGLPRYAPEAVRY